MTEKELTSEESLSLITDMIAQAKKNQALGGSFYFLLWGWVVMLANLGHYIMEKFSLYEFPYVVWLITIPAAIVSFVYGFMKDRSSTVRTHYDRIYSVLWISIFVMIIVTLLFMARLNYNHNPIILLFSGLGTFVSGYLLKFRPLLLGGLIIWVGAIMGLMVSVSDQTLIAAIVVTLGYLVPGYMLRKAESERI